MPLRIEPMVRDSRADCQTIRPEISRYIENDNSKDFSNGLG